MTVAVAVVCCTGFEALMRVKEALQARFFLFWGSETGEEGLMNNGFFFFFFLRK